MKEWKKDRQSALREIIESEPVSKQEDLRRLLEAQGFKVTQATLSRDIKALKIIKSPDSEGDYVYTLPGKKNHLTAMERKRLPEGIISLDFSNGFGVIKTPPGYAGVIALDIDNLKDDCILGTIAGDDTILLIPREGCGKEEILKALSCLQ